MVLCDAFYYSVEQGRMVKRVVGGVECHENCDFGQIHGAKLLWDSFIVSKMTG